MQTVSSKDRNIECLDSADATTLQLSGVVDVRIAHDLAHAAKHCAERKLPTRIVGEGVTSADTAALQILVALRNAGAAGQWSVTIENSSTELTEIVALAGLSEALGLASSCTTHCALPNAS